MSRLATGKPFVVTGACVVVGSAPCVFEDVKAAKALRPSAALVAINEAGAAFKDIQHLYSGHYNKAAEFARYRESRGYSLHGVLIHACWGKNRKMPACVTHTWAGTATGGSSALTAARVALAMGYTEVILAGCPMDASGYFNEAETNAVGGRLCRLGRGDKLAAYRRRFSANIAERGREGLYSMSGWTREQLGFPP